jgi:mannose-1-phosphate guanylyltransferase/mannose-6-phosphate isomerase
MIKVNTVVLCGGSGSRLWPLSREEYPKQFIKIAGKQSLFQQTVKRIANINKEEIKFEKLIIVANVKYKHLVTEQLLEVDLKENITILEPIARNTAPALTSAALYALEYNEDPVLLVLPSDQNIQNNLEFLAKINKAIKEAEDGSIVVFGIKPNEPLTGYGYIKTIKKEENEIQKVIGFEEKPNYEKAKKFIKDDNYYWNSGIFVFKASVWMKKLEELRPDIYNTTKLAWLKRKNENDSKSNNEIFINPSAEEYEKIPSDSIDYAVIEKCTNSINEMKMYELNAGWSDLGTWDAIWDMQEKDHEGNASIGDVISLETKNSLIYSNSRLITIIGVEDIIVIETNDAVLIVKKNKTQEIKKIVNELKKRRREEYLTHKKVYRPWGSYDNILEEDRFKVKRIIVKPKASLSLQLHHHRAEHWIVVKGTAEITVGLEKYIYTENQSTYIPLGEKHRLRNPGNIPLEIIEIQTGSYLGEDDIVRFEDDYGRNQ